MFTAYTEGADGRQQGGTSDFQGDFKNEVEEGEDYDDEEDEFVRDGSGKILRKWQQKKQRQNEMFRDRDRRAHEARREEVVKEALYYSAITLEDSEEEEHHGMKGLPEHLCPRPDTRSSAYKSFPDVKKELKTEIDDDIDDFPPKKRKEKRKRKSSRSPSRRRKPSGSPQPGSSKNRPQQLQQPSKNSWNLLKTSTYREIDQNLSKLIAGLLVYERSREREAEIFDSVGRQAAKFRIAMRFIDNGSQKLFNIFYPSLGAKLERETRSFHQKLAVANKHQPRETQFRRCEFDWNGEFIIPLSDKPYDKYDLWLEEGERRKEAEAKIEQCGALGVDVKSLTDLQVRNQLLNSQLNKQPKNIELWLDFIKLQDEIYLSQKESGAMDNAKRMLRERKDAILVDAIAKNPRVSLFQRMYIENMIADPMTVYKKYEDLLHKFPHEIHIWEKYLDYVQHNNSLYGREQMDKAF
ncbi:unnamed protein product [Caenorhabditis auriculariae]|uniref:Uncharacterized protein n=1 Tax=Caenorhabditis auriculariae TaxID=2777116 RepID=A0A8S1HKL7_9PELO|nr:unnamed protein product [Caenorhabditis auriculariae]